LISKNNFLVFLAVLRNEWVFNWIDKLLVEVMIVSGGQLLEIRLLDNHLLDTFGRKSIARHKIYQLLESGWARINWIQADFSSNRILSRWSWPMIVAIILWLSRWHFTLLWNLFPFLVIIIHFFEIIFVSRISNLAEIYSV
jgi:hypothetical protein